MIWHSSEKEAVLNFFSTDSQTGLTSQKASELNALKTQGVDGPVLKIFKLVTQQLGKTFFIVITVLAALCTVLSAVSGGLWWPYITAIIILLLSCISFALQKYFTSDSRKQVKSIRRCDVKVLRDGNICELPSDQIVLGDIILLSTGDYIPVDARLLETDNFRCDEYALTNEVVDVEKESNAITEDIAAINMRKNMVFAGCSVTHGSAKAVVTDIDADTEIQRMLLLNKSSQSSDIPFGKTIELVKKYSLSVAIGVTALICLVLMIVNLTKTDLNFALFVCDSLFNSLPIIIAAVPETLPITAALIIWAAFKQLSNKGIVFNRLSALEKAADISVICADKTGVLTPDNMTVEQIFDGNEIKDVLDVNPGPAAVLTAKLALVCGNGINNTDNSSSIIVDSSEKALFEFCSKFEFAEREQLLNSYPLLAHIPFDNTRRRITSVNMINGKPFVIVKGSPEGIIPLCKGADADKITSVYEKMASDGLRVIAVAYRPINELPAIPTAEELEHSLTFSGFIGLSDTPDSDIIATIEQCEEAGIKTVMATGDSDITAKVLARRIGIFHDGMLCATSDELKSLRDEELYQDITGYAVFARIDDTDRYRIIKSLMHNNETVAVTGSKSTDAPVLRKADIGFAIDETATDVARNAADIIVSNGRISTLLNVIKNARNLFAEIKKIIYYFLSCNLGELLVLLIGVLLFSEPMLIASQLLLINLITDILPCIALGTSPADDSVLDSGAKHNRNIFTVKSSLSMLIQAVIICVLTLIAFAVGKTVSVPTAQTMALATLSILQIIHIFPSYSERLLIDSNILKHRYIFISSALCVVLLLIILLSPLSAFFGLTMLSLNQWLLIILFAAIMFAADELIKIGFNIYYKFKK